MTLLDATGLLVTLFVASYLFFGSYVLLTRVADARSSEW